MEIYVVQPGDNVDKIANDYGISVEQLIYDNQIIQPYRLAVGQALFINTGEAEILREAVFNGYAYTFISPYVLDQTLPSLSALSIFSYGFTGEGDLVYPSLDDEWMIERALAQGVQPILTLTPLDEKGTFNNNLITAVVNNEAARDNLVTQLLTVMQQKGYTGLDIDFEFILAEDRDAFTTFVAETTRQMNAVGYTVSVALAPKTSANQKGLLYEGKDYGGLGAAANSVLLMTYEWGYTYGPPMAVSPIDKVRKVLEYALTEIPAAKIDMGIPNYGYDWPLPYERGVTKAKTIGNIEAVQIAIEYGAEIMFDEMSQAPFFNYFDGTIEHEVWFDDVRSIRAKLGLINEYGLRGAGYWQIMRLFRANWLVQESIYKTRRI